ncbi:MAG: hypothetical protein IAE78_08145 [Myxococcus sp.]|nr:hypothetical protein [Myxococcus sp.]
MIRTRSLLLALVVVGGCTREAAPVKDVTVAEAAAQFEAGTATPVDANTQEYRDAVGWVPGAVRLADYANYPLTDLPEDKGRALVFYCTSRM